MLKVRDIMTSDPVTVGQDTRLDEVIGLMKSNQFRHILVIENERLAGIITDRDLRLVMNSPLIRHDPKEDVELLHSHYAKDCMTTNPVTVQAEAAATEAASLMQRFKFGGLPVLDADGRLIGIVTVSDVLKSYVALLEVQNPSP
jgi:acetoin utilization protein AcuB